MIPDFPLSALNKCTLQEARASQVNLPANGGDIRDEGLIPGLGKSPRGGHGNPLQFFLPGESHGQRSLVGYSPWSREESDTTEVT